MPLPTPTRPVSTACGFELEAVKAELKTVKAQTAAQASTSATPAKLAVPASAPASVTVAAAEPSPQTAMPAPAPVPTTPYVAPLGTATPYQALLASTTASGQTSFFGYGEISHNRPFRDQPDPDGRAPGGDRHCPTRPASAPASLASSSSNMPSRRRAIRRSCGRAALRGAPRRRQRRRSRKGGLFLIPLGFLNLTHEPTSYYGVERNFVETAIIPSTWREIGLSAFGVSDAGLRWDVGLTSGFNLNKWNGSAEGKESPLASIHQEGQLARGNNLSAYGAVSWRGTPGLDVGAGVFSGKLAHKVKTPSEAETSPAGV